MISAQKDSIKSVEFLCKMFLDRNLTLEEELNMYETARKHCSDMSRNLTLLIKNRKQCQNVYLGNWFSQKVDDVESDDEEEDSVEYPDDVEILSDDEVPPPQSDEVPAPPKT